MNGNTSAPNPNFSYDAISNGSGVIGYTLKTTTNPWSITSPDFAAIHLKSQVNLVGGGQDGLRGTSQVFGAWVQVATANPSGVGTYPSSPTNHQMVRIEANNGSAASGIPYAGNGGTPVFEGADSPSFASAPLLDSSMPTSGVGTGGNSSAMGSSLVTSAPLPSGLGQGNTYQAVDGPRFSFPSNDIAFPESEVTGIQTAYCFTDSLVLWSNVTGNIGPSGASFQAFDHMYAVILEQPWNTMGTLNVDTGQVATAAASCGGSGQAVVHNPVIALPATTVIGCPPTALACPATWPTTWSLRAFDARQ